MTKQNRKRRAAAIRRQAARDLLSDLILLLQGLPRALYRFIGGAMGHIVLLLIGAGGVLYALYFFLQAFELVMRYTIGG